MKRLTEGHHQEWSLRLNSIQHEKTHQVQTWHLVVCFFSRNVHPYSFLCGPVLLSARVALSSRAGSPSGTRTHTKGLLMHSCSQPSGTPLEESAAWNDQGWVWPSQLWLVANSPSVTSSGRRKRGDLGRILGSPRCVQRQGVRARISVAATGASAVSCRGARLVAQQRGTLCGEAGERRRRSLRMECGHPEVARGHLR